MRTYLRLLRYARPHGRSWMLIFALTVIGAGFSALQPWPMKIVVDHVLGTNDFPGPLAALLSWFPSISTPKWLLVFAVCGGILIFAFTSAADALLAVRWTVTGRRMVYDLASDLFARLQRRSLTFHKKSAVADLMGRVTVDSWSVYQVAETLFFSPLHAVLMTASMIWLMYQLDQRLTLLTVLIAPMMVASSFLLGKPLRAAAKLKRDIENRIQAHIQQTLTGIPVVQSFGQEARASSRFDMFAGEAIRSQQRSALLGSVNSLTSGLVATLGTGLVLWIGARDVLSGTLTIGSLLVFLVYLSSLQAQVKTFAGLYTALQGLSATANRSVEILEAVSEIPEPKTSESFTSIKGEVEFQNVSAGYDPGNAVLKEVSFRVSPGETIALVGPTGAGKSTLVSLVPRFLDVSSGMVLVDGHDVRNVNLRELREHIGMVLQESFLLPLSVSENIAYGRPDATREEIETAARGAHAHGFIAELKDGYQTVIGERGLTLSGGQRQRLAIARAILKNPPILILDEPTSALDAETEHLIMGALHRLMQDRTTFVIAHRLSTIRAADRIIVLESGRIVEIGKHDELLAAHGAYFKLHNLQKDLGTLEVPR